MRKATAFLLIAGLSAVAQLAVAAEITGTVTIKGTPPKEKDITPLKEDENCGKLTADMPTTHFYLVGPKSELGDVVVYLKGIGGKSTGAKAKPVVLDQKKCLYVPQIMAVQTGQKVLVRNSDPVMHNVHTEPRKDSGNPIKNDPQMAGAADLGYTFPKAEMFLKFKCDVHPWMFAWISIFDHPYFALSDKEGAFKISDVPPGKYTLEAAHRKLGTVSKEIEVKEGEPTKVDFVMEVK